MNGQHGFRQCRSITTALMDQYHVTGVVYLDLKKAFDTVDYTILIHKLKTMGVTNYSLVWFDSYLGHRVRRTSY